MRNPNLDEARNQLALVYNHVGAFDAALGELERAVEINPGNNLAQFREAQAAVGVLQNRGGLLIQRRAG